jgi:hypothetical protein
VTPPRPIGGDTIVGQSDFEQNLARERVREFFQHARERGSLAELTAALDLASSKRWRDGLPLGERDEFGERIAMVLARRGRP